MELPYSVLMERIRSVCIDYIPVGRSVTEACEQISKFASADRTVEFDTDADVETFYISDPYWLSICAAHLSLLRYPRNSQPEGDPKITPTLA